MNLQSYFESCLLKRKNLRLRSSLPHVSVRFPSPALFMQQCTQSISQCPVQTVLSNKSFFSPASYTFSSASIPFPCYPDIQNHHLPGTARGTVVPVSPTQGQLGPPLKKKKGTSDFSPHLCTDFTDSDSLQDCDLTFCLSVF